MRHLFTKGERHEFQDLYVHGVTSYQVDSYDFKKMCDCKRTVYRYDLRTIDGQRFVYSGNCLHILHGEWLLLKATIKVPLDAYGFTRLARPIVLERTSKPRDYLL